MLSRLSSYLGELDIDESRKSCGSHRSSVNGEQTEVFSQSKYENGKHGSQSNSRYSSDSEYFWFMIFPRFFFYKFQYLNIFQHQKYYFLEFSQNRIYFNLFLSIHIYIQSYNTKKATSVYNIHNMKNPYFLCFSKFKLCDVMNKNKF